LENHQVTASESVEDREAFGSKELWDSEAEPERLGGASSRKQISSLTLAQAFPPVK
jgi:hypothetical protein